MKTIGMFKAMRLCKAYRKMDGAGREALRQERLDALVRYARERSPYYARLYAAVPEDAPLAALPSVNKVELMAHWDEWVTDRDITLAEVNAFMQNLDNIGRKCKGKYMVFTTSGSTGNPLVALCDATTNNVMGAVNALRSFAHKEDMGRFIRRGGRTIGVFATGGFYLGNSSVRSRLLRMPWKKRQMAVTSALLPIDEIVAQLNAFQPAMLGGYPSNLELLIEKQKSGALHIAPVLIMTGGEYLSDALRAALAEAFGCRVQTSYSCTEGGTVACECPERHFHINDDWLIVEPVDKDGHPVPAGTRADKLLLTNLFNYTQPYIRYEVTDRVIWHDEPCPCGNPSPWLELEGRCDDVTAFVQDGKRIQIAPLAVYAALKEVHALARFQWEVRDGNETVLRLVPAAGVAREAAFAEAEAALRRFLATQGVADFSCALAPEPPAPNPGSGKFKHIVNKQSVS